MASKRVKLAVFDLDGTLTVAHGDVHISCCGVRIVRLLESINIKVSLITGNSLPVAAGVAKYLGATGPVAAENGCVISDGGSVIHVCSGSIPGHVVDEVKKMGFRESWQNAYRYHEVALIPERHDLNLISAAINYVKRLGFNAIWTGYALHIQPPGGGKLAGLSKIVELAGASLEEVIVFGDGDNDAEMLRAVALSGAPGDASLLARSSARYVARLPGALGVAEIIERVLGVRTGCF